MADSPASSAESSLRPQVNMRSFSAFLSFASLAVVCGQNIVLTNDDGWAVAQIRAEYTALTAAGFDVRIDTTYLPKGPTNI